MAPLLYREGMRQRQRHQRKKHQQILPWPAQERTPTQVADEVRYVGSPEHKGAWSAMHQPALRSDASECPPQLSDNPEEHTAKLQAAIQAGCVGGGFEDGFPKYVWVWLADGLWEARHMRGPYGTYKAYGPLEHIEHPRDPEGLLQAARGEEG